MSNLVFNASSDMVFIEDIVEGNIIHKKLKNGMTIHADYNKTHDKKIQVTVEIFLGKQSIAREGFLTPAQKGTRKNVFVSLVNNLKDRVINDIEKYERKNDAFKDGCVSKKVQKTAII